MTVLELIAQLTRIAAGTPNAVVMLSKGDERSWFDEIEEVGLCRINRNHDGLDCGPPDVDAALEAEVVVIR